MAGIRLIEFPIDKQTHANAGKFSCKVGSIEIVDNGNVVIVQPITAANNKPLFDATLRLPRHAATLRAIAAELLFISEEI